MSDNATVFNAIETYLAANWTATAVQYPNTQYVDTSISGATTDLGEGTEDYVSFSATFGLQKAREVGATSKQCHGVVVFHAHTRLGNGDSILHALSGQLVDLFSWTKEVAGVVFTDGRAFTAFDKGQWRVIPCSIDFYFNKT